MKKQTECACGAELPQHLADLQIGVFHHICSCERKYEVKGGKFKLVGTEVNPIARYDNKVANWPTIFDCGCSKHKVAAGLCDVYDTSGKPRHETPC